MDASSQFTSLTETWALCNNLADEEAYQEIPQVATDFEENRERIMIPVPSAEVVGILKQLCRSDVQDFLKKLTDHFSECACSHRGNECFENVQPTYPQLDTVLESPMCTAQLPSLIENSQDFGSLDSSASLEGIIPHSSFQKEMDVIPTSLEEIVTSTPVKATFKEPVARRSPRKHFTSSGQESSQSHMQVKLLEAYDVTVHKDGLRKAISAAKKAQKPGYMLCYQLLPEVFSLETLANSRGQGMTAAKEGDLRPCLNKTKVSAIKDYVVVWCKKNSHPTPLEPSLNDAITEKISYARKQLKLALKKLKND